MKVKEAVAKVTRDLKVDARRHLIKRPLTEAELAEELRCTVSEAQMAIRQLRRAGLSVSQVAGGRWVVQTVLDRGGHLLLKSKPNADGWFEFGYTTDNHLCNKHSRLDVVEAAYDEFEARGITDVFNAGNMIDGEFRFNRSELLVFGIDPQLEYLANEFPQRKGITTHFITGDDHEGWFSQRELINIGKHMESVAEKAGRKDLHYIGHVEADLELRTGKGSAIMRVMHPGGGSAYALSYAPQKIVEAFQGGEKPPILLIGHYHKFDYCFPREVHVLSGGCTCDQTMFMRKNKIAAHVGYAILRVKQDKVDGHVEAVDVCWRPFYDLGFYQRRFARSE